MTGIDAEEAGLSSGGIDSEEPPSPDQSPGLTAAATQFQTPTRVQQEVVERIAEQKVEPKYQQLHKEFIKQNARFEDRVSEIENQLDQATVSEQKRYSEIKSVVANDIHQSVTLTGIGIGTVSVLVSLVFMSPLLLLLSIATTTFLIYSYRKSPQYSNG